MAVLFLAVFIFRFGGCEQSKEKEIKSSERAENTLEVQELQNPFNVIKVSIGAVKNKATNSFNHNVSSPIFIDFYDSYVKDGSYFLFSNKEAIDAEDFQIEYIFTNAAPTDDKQVGEETYRFMTNDKISITFE